MRVRCLLLAATLVCALLPASVAHAGTAYVAGRVLHHDATPGTSDDLAVSGTAETLGLSSGSAGAGRAIEFGCVQYDTSGFDSVEIELGACSTGSWCTAR